PPRWYCSPPHRHGGALATDRCAADAEKTLAYKALCLIPRTGPLAGVCLQSLRGLLGLLAVVLVAAGALGVARAASPGASANTATQSATRVVAVAATSRISSWLRQADQELHDNAAAP